MKETKVTLSYILSSVEEACGEEVKSLLCEVVLKIIKENWESIRLGSDFSTIRKWAALMEKIKPALIELEGKQTLELFPTPNPPVTEEIQEEEEPPVVLSSSDAPVSSSETLDAYVFRRNGTRQTITRRTAPLTRTPGDYFWLLTPLLYITSSDFNPPPCEAYQNLTKNNLHNLVITNADRDPAFEGWPDEEERKRPGGHDAWKGPCDVAIDWFVELGYLVRVGNSGSTYERTSKPINDQEILSKLRSVGYLDTDQYPIESTTTN